MHETPFFFPCDLIKLFGVLHEPSGKSRKTGFVFCHPFFEEKLWTHRVFVNFARRLSMEGYPVLRFDYMGNGDSQGNFADSDVESYLRNIQTAIAFLESTGSIPEGVNLLGLRLGATLVSMTAERCPGLKRLLLWEPIVNGSKYMKEMLRINITTQAAVYKEVRQNTEMLVGMMKSGQSVNIDGYEMQWPLYQQISEIDLLAEPKHFQGPVLIVQINRMHGQGVDRLQSLAARYRNYHLREAVEEPFWKEIIRYYSKADSLFDVTLDWLRTT